MDMNTLTKFLESVTLLFQALFWPLIVLFILINLIKPLKKLLNDNNLSDLIIRAGPTGLEATIKKQQIVGSLAAASATQVKLAETTDKPIPPALNVQEITKLVDKVVTSSSFQRLSGATALWVDDMPSNNTYVRNALEELGIRFTICISTDDALKQLRYKMYDLIISDMGRPPDLRAGYTLLERVQEMKITTPFIIYAAGGRKSENQDEAIRKGAYGSTSGSDGLFALVINAITKD
jgi:CheY-like chemotaxis protein